MYSLIFDTMTPTTKYIELFYENRHLELVVPMRTNDKNI